MGKKVRMRWVANHEFVQGFVSRWAWLLDLQTSPAPGRHALIWFWWLVHFFSVDWREWVARRVQSTQCEELWGVFREGEARREGCVADVWSSQCNIELLSWTSENLQVQLSSKPACFWAEEAETCPEVACAWLSWARWHVLCMEIWFKNSVQTFKYRSAHVAGMEEMHPEMWFIK